MVKEKNENKKIDIDYTGYVPEKDIAKSFKESVEGKKLKPLILIEGGDCSGKETQSRLLVEQLNKHGVVAEYRSYPNYKTPFGYMIGASYLGKPHMGSSIFPQKIEEIDPRLAGQLYAINRYEDKAQLGKILTNNVVVLDRYVESNMAYQGGLKETKAEREEMFEYFYQLEYNLNGLVQPTLRILIFMPQQYVNILKAEREELPDEMESSCDRLQKAEKAYLELASKYNFYIVNCIKENADYLSAKKSDIKSPQQINEEIFNIVMQKLKI